MQDRQDEILIYQSQDGTIKVDVLFEGETVWLTQAQLCTLFGKSKATISEHIKHIFEEGELNPDAVVRKFRTTTQQGTQFRTWATQRLREYIIKGFALTFQPV